MIVPRDVHSHLATLETTEKGTGAEMHPAIVCGMVIGGAPVSYWSIFPRVTSNSPRSLLKVNSAQFPSAF